MYARHQVLGSLIAATLAGCPGVGSDSGGETPRDLTVDLPAFEAIVDVGSTCDGEDVSPPVRFRAVPAAASLALVVDDSEAPTDGTAADVRLPFTTRTVEEPTSRRCRLASGGRASTAI